MNTNKQKRTAFTLAELLLVIAIIGILTALGLSVLRGAEEDALKARTQAQINRITKLLNAKLEENIYRILPSRLDPSTDPQDVDDFRKRALAEIMLVEFPSELDHVNPASFPRNSPTPPLNYDWANDFPAPQMLYRYNAFFTAKGVQSAAEQQAECLYAILSLNYAEDGTALVEILRKTEIANTDKNSPNLADRDEYLEVVDAWGDPLEFQLVDENGIVISPDTNPLEPQQYRFHILSRNLKNAL